MVIPSSIMVVDDDHDQANLFNLFLARLGVDSISFNDPSLALKHYEQYSGRYSLVLLDWMMPRINGINLANKLRNHNPKVKIVLVSGHFIKDIITNDEFKKVNIIDVIQKPVSFMEFGRRIKQVLC